MARFPKRKYSGGFRLSDILRLMSAIGMLCVLAMLMTRVRDANMWRWVNRDWEHDDGPPAEVVTADETAAEAKIAVTPAGEKSLEANPAPIAKTVDPKPQAPSVAQAPAVLVTGRPEPPPEPENRPEFDIAKSDAANSGELPPQDPPSAAEVVPVDYSNEISHLNPEEWRQAQFEFQLLQDKEVVESFDMPAYWRLLNWVRHQTPDQLEARANKRVSFSDFVEQPNKMRGQLVRLKLHVLRTKRYEAANNRYGFKWLHEVWGYTNDSQPYPYAMVFSDWPKGMPLGNNLTEEATVDAYFLKHLKYEAHDGRMRWAPLMMGRVVWHPNPMSQSRAGLNEIWFTILGVGGVAVLLVGIWAYRAIFGSPKVTIPITPLADTSRGEDWVEEMEAGDDVPAFLVAAQTTNDGLSSEVDHDSGQ